MAATGIPGEAAVREPLTAVSVAATSIGALLIAGHGGGRLVGAFVERSWLGPWQWLWLGVSGGAALTAAFVLRALAMRLAAAAVSRERKRLARELHDGLSNELALIATRATDPAIAEAVDRAMGEARSAIYGLRATGTATFAELVERLVDDLARRWGREAHVEVISSSSSSSSDLPLAAQEPVLRVVREAMANAYRHGGAQRVRVVVDLDDRLVRVEDDGCGFVVSRCVESPSGSALGFLGMRERLASIGGVLSVRSTVGAGSSVEVVLP